MPINKDVHIRHFRSCLDLQSAKSPLGAITTAVVIEEGENGKLIANIGWSFCDPRDAFSKKAGSVIAKERLEQSPIVAPLGYAKGQAEINVVVMAALLCSGEMPNASISLIHVMLADNIMGYHTV